jgi:type I restriction enzyme S subunit
MNIDRLGRTDLSEIKYVEPERDLLLARGDVLFNNTNSPTLIGKTAYFDRPGDYAFSNHMTRLRPPPGLDGKFLAIQLHFFWMRGVFQQLCSHHVNQASVSAKKLVDAVCIAVPPTNEQRRIVAAIEEQFSRLDAAGESLGAAQRKLAGLRDGALEAAFSGDWPWTTLGEIAELVGGVTKDAKRQSDPAFVEVPYLRVANVQRGYLDLKEITTIRVPEDKAEALALRPGDVLFNEGGDRDKLGRGWVWSGEIDGCIHQNHVFRARLHEDFEPKFISWHGNTFGRRWFEANGRQTTNLASLNLTTLKSFPVPAPPLDAQRRVVAELESRLSELEAMSAAIAKAHRWSAALRRSILERAFRGELVGQDPADEPAAALLERITAERVVPKQRPKVPV